MKTFALILCLIVGLLTSLLIKEKSKIKVDLPKVKCISGRNIFLCLPEEYQAIEKGDTLVCDSVNNNTIYLSFKH